MAEALTLPPHIRTYVVEALACFDAPALVAQAVQLEFGLELSRETIEACDPTRSAGAKLGRRWRRLFEATRRRFLEDPAGIGISQRAVRLRAIERMAAKAEAQGALKLAADLHKQAAEEAAGARRDEAGGPSCAPAEITPEMTAQQAAEAYANALDGDD